MSREPKYEMNHFVDSFKGEAPVELRVEVRQGIVQQAVGTPVFVGHHSRVTIPFENYGQLQQLLANLVQMTALGAKQVEMIRVDSSKDPNRKPGPDQVHVKGESPVPGPEPAGVCDPQRGEEGEEGSGEVETGGGEEGRPGSGSGHSEEIPARVMDRDEEAEGREAESRAEGDPHSPERAGLSG